jgi:hypothetical protein
MNFVQRTHKSVYTLQLDFIFLKLIRDHLEDLVVDGRTILKWILIDLGCENVDWIHLAQDRDL